jgi:hypothetical protein
MVVEMEAPAVLINRLSALSGAYRWDVDSNPFHSSYGMTEFTLEIVIN